MGFFRWLSGVFGGSHVAAKAAAPERQRHTPVPVQRERAQAWTRTPIPEDPVRQSWDKLKSFVARCESEELDLAGLRVEDPTAYWLRHTAIESAKLDGASPEDAAKAAGFLCLDHWSVVQRYFQARYSELVKLPNGKLAIRHVDAFQRAAEEVDRQVAEQRARREREAADLEPIGGVSLERFAEICAALAHLGAEATRTRTTEVFAAYGLGSATFGSVRRGWEARMEADATRRLRRIFRQAWTHVHQNLENGTWKLPGAGDRKDEVSGVSTRYTWVESVEARAEYRSSLLGSGAA